MKSMNNNIIGGIAVVALLIGGFAANRHIPSIDEILKAIPIGATSVQVTDGSCLLSPEGVHLCTIRKPLIAGTSTPFGVQTVASSTIVANMTFCTQKVATSTASVWTWAKAATKFASTTVISNSTVAASVLSPTIVSTTTIGVATPSGVAVPYPANLELGPNQWLNLTLSGALSPADGVSVNTAPGLPSLGYCVATYIY